MREPPRDADSLRNRLYDLMAADLDFETKARRALELGRSHLDVETAVLTRIEPRTDSWEAVVSTDAADDPLGPGTTLDLATTYCRHVLESDGRPFVVHDAEAEGLADDPGHTHHDVDCYHGTTVTVGEERFGTLCFLSGPPRPEPFTEAETTFAELIARLLEHELERDRHEADLARRERLIGVLNRVLRHNLRNELAVVRGRANGLLERPGDDGSTAAEEIVGAADDLLALAEKARQLDSVVGPGRDRRPTRIDTTVERIVADVTADYPDATVTVDATAATVDARPSIERAVREVIENAAKHAGPAPTVDVTAAADSDRIRIEVVDDGPGLPAHERRVLEQGAETPLVHGSGLGLWLVHWVVGGHGGALDVDADGNRVRITLPRRRSVDDPTPVPADDREPVATERYRALFENAFAAVALIDEDRRILDANPSAEAAFGVAERDLLGRRFDELVPDDADPPAIWRSIVDGPGRPDSVPIERSDGTRTHVDYGVATDVTPGHHLVVFHVPDEPDGAGG